MGSYRSPKEEQLDFSILSFFEVLEKCRELTGLPFEGYEEFWAWLTKQ